jgi:hypothetical protein
MGHSSTSIRDRYRHELAGQLPEDAVTLEAFLTRQPAQVVDLRTGARTGAHPLETASVSQAQ